jgi:hypothetical protein
VLSVRVCPNSHSISSRDMKNSYECVLEVAS